MTYPFLNFNGVTVEVWKWISSLISHFTRYVIIYPCWDHVYPCLSIFIHVETIEIHVSKMGFSDPGCENVIATNFAYIIMVYSSA